MIGMAVGPIIDGAMGIIGQAIAIPAEHVAMDLVH